MKIKVKKGLGAKAAFAGAILALIATVYFIIYGASFSQYFDITVLICFLLGVLCMGANAACDFAFSDLLSFIGVAAVGFGMGLFIINGLNVIQDMYGNYNMYGSFSGNFDYYGSEGGIVLFAVMVVLCLLSAICGIVSCFSTDRKEAVA